MKRIYVALSSTTLTKPEDEQPGEMAYALHVVGGSSPEIYSRSDYR